MPGKFAIGWTQVAVCFVLLAAISMIASSFGLVAVPLEKEFGVSRKVLMLALTGLSLGSALISPLLGNLMDRVSMHTMMLAGALSICAGFLALSAVTAFWQVLVGRIAQDDAEAARAIGNEIRELLDQMRDGIAAADPAVIREAATKAKNIAGMLSPDVGAKVSAAIKEARDTARAMVKRIEKAGERAADVVAQCSTARIEAARFAFLDLDDAVTVTPEAPAARGLDLQPDEQTAAEAYAAPGAVRPLELF